MSFIIYKTYSTLKFKNINYLTILNVRGIGIIMDVLVLLNRLKKVILS